MIVYAMLTPFLLELSNLKRTLSMLDGHISGQMMSTPTNHPSLPSRLSIYKRSITYLVKNALLSLLFEERSSADNSSSPAARGWATLRWKGEGFAVSPPPPGASDFSFTPTASPSRSRLTPVLTATTSTSDSSDVPKRASCGDWVSGGGVLCCDPAALPWSVEGRTYPAPTPGDSGRDREVEEHPRRS